MAQLIVRSVAIATIVSLVLLLSIDKPWAAGAEPPATLTDLHDVEALRGLFQPSCGSSSPSPAPFPNLSHVPSRRQLGAGGDLGQISLAHLRVYAVWLPMVWSDTRRAWESSMLADPRVIHLWDEKRTIGQWFADHIDGCRGVTWDTYYVYGPEARWDLFLGEPTFL